MQKIFHYCVSVNKSTALLTKGLMQVVIVVARLRKYLHLKETYQKSYIKSLIGCFITRAPCQSATLSY